MYVYIFGRAKWAKQISTVAHGKQACQWTKAMQKAFKLYRLIFMFPPNLMISMFASQCARPVPVLNSPYLCVGFLFPTSLCGVLAFDSVSRLLRLLLRRLRLHFVTHHLSHTTFLTPSFSHHLTHTTLSHTISLTQLCLTPSFSHHLTHTTLSHTIFLTPSHSHNFVTHHLSHTISLTQLCHTPSFTHNFVTRTIFHTQLCHPQSLILSHTIFHPQLCFTHNFVTHHQLCHTPSFTHNFVTHNFVTHNFVTHHLSQTTFCCTLRGRRAT